MLFRSNANQVITCDASNNNFDYSSRKYDSNNNLIFSSMNDDFKLENKTFDCIIHSELLQNEMNPETKLEEFSNLLKNDGTLIISILNNENQNLIYNKSDNVEFLSKDELLNILKTQFSQINLYSQKLVTKKEIINRRLHSLFLLKVKLRFFLSTILLKFDPKSNFYNKIIKTKIRRLNTEFADQSSDINNSNSVVSNDYTPIPYSESDNPLFFIAVCKKNSN